MKHTELTLNLPPVRVAPPDNGAAGPTFTLDELLSVFDAKLYCASPVRGSSSSPRRATAPGGAPFATFGGGFGGHFHSLPGTPEPAGGGSAPGGGAFGGGAFGGGAFGGGAFGGGDGDGGADGSPFEAAQRAGGEGVAAVVRALSPELRAAGGLSPRAPWMSNAMAEAWDAASSDASRSAASSPDRGPPGCGGFGARGAAAGWRGDRIGGSSIDLGALSRGARRGVAASEPGTIGRSALGAASAGGAPRELPALCGFSSGGGGYDGASTSGGGGHDASPLFGSSGGGAALGDDSDCLCVVEVAMAAAVEATTRPPRGGRGGKHRQKAKLNQSLQQLAGHADADAAQVYVDTCLGVYRKQHNADPAALELLTRHLAYLIGGVVRFRLGGLIPWHDLPVPAPHELADKSRTPTYKAWLCRLGVVTPEAFSDGGAE